MHGFSACLRCGSLDLRMVKALDGGGIPGYEFDRSHCKACGWNGLPLEFDDEAAWKQFVEARKDWRSEAATA
ncbi:MAG: hypothetical protein V4510_04975 [bacterium]